nr:hypothetical protein [Nocardia abscessus]
MSEHPDPRAADGRDGLARAHRSRRPTRPRPGPEHLGFAVPLRLRRDEGELRLITTLTSFATAVDVTLAELQLEAFLPGDEQTARILRGRAARRLGE